MRIFVWNVLVKVQGWDWFCITYSEKSAELLGAVVTAAPQNGHWHLCRAHPQQLHRCKGWQLEAVGWCTWEEPGDSSVLARKDSRQLWPRNEHLGVCQSLKEPTVPQQRWAGVGWGAHAHTPEGLPCLSLPSSPHCSPQELSSTVCNPWRIQGQLTLEKGRMYGFDTLFVLLLSPIPKSVIKSLLLLAINCIQFSDSEMFCLRQVCCWFTRSTTLIFQVFSPVLVCNSSLRHTFLWKGP